jgi:hypothetical protein
MPLGWGAANRNLSKFSRIGLRYTVLHGDDHDVVPVPSAGLQCIVDSRGLGPIRKQPSKVASLAWILLF